MYNRILNIGLFAVILASGLFTANAQNPGDVDLGRNYCDPIYGTRPDQYSNLQGYYPFARFGSIIFTEKESGSIAWEWYEDCSLVHRNTYKHLLEEYDKEPIELKPGVEYTVELNVEMPDRLSRFSDFAARVYYDNNENVQFEQFDDNEYIFWQYRNVNQSNSNPGPKDFCNDWEWNAIGWNGGEHWYTFSFDWVPTGTPIKETRMRFLISYNNPRSKFAQNACQSGEVNTTFGWAYPQDGQAIDQTLRIVCPDKESFPSEDNFLLAQELYNDENRQPKRGGAAIDFNKFSIDFTSLYDAGTDVKIEVLGPFPDQTAVWIATDANGSQWIDVSPNNINNTANLSFINGGSGFRWESAYQADYEGSNPGWTQDENGNDLTAGEFYALRSGSYAIRLTARDANGDVPACGQDFFEFSIKADWDLEAAEIVSPRNYDEPFFRKYEIGNPYSLEARYQNLGLAEINEFVAKVEIMDPDGDLYLEDEFNYDKNNPDQTVVLPNEQRDIVFSKRFVPQEPGLYSMRFYVESIEGNPERDQNRFNNHLPRPTGGTARDGWEFDNKYLVEVVYSLDLVGDQVIFPEEAPEVDENFVIQNRPFRPVVRFLNNGFQDASKVVAQLEIRDENDNVVASVPEYIIEIIPSGRFNSTDVVFPEVTVREAGEYTVWARVDNVNEPFAVIDEGNEVEGTFTVEPGISGVYTVGTRNAGNDRNYMTINDAMNDVYFYGISGDVTFELTDPNYVLNGNTAAWDFRSTIIGLGYNEEIDETFTMTWKAAANRELIRGGVTVTMNTTEGYGVRFGQGIFNEHAAFAPVNSSTSDDYLDFSGHVIFDGGNVNALRFVMNSGTEFASPFFLGQGTHNVTLRNLIIENSDENSHINRVRVPVRSDDGKVAEFETDETTKNVGGNSVVTTYSSGITLRAVTFDIEDLLEDNEDLIGVELPVQNIEDNTIEGNEISDFGYGIVSIGIGGIFIEDEESASYENYNNRRNTFSGNRIHNVGRAGIALGNEEFSTVSNNIITDVNPLDVSNVNDGAGDYDHAGIMAGGLIFEDGVTGTKQKGYSVRELVIDGNQINTVHSDIASTGIKVEQNFIIYDPELPASRLEMPEGNENVRVSNNVIKDLNITDPNARKFGIRLFTERQNFNDPLIQDTDYPGYRTTGDKIVNNTIIINQNEEGVASNDWVMGVALQQVEDTESFNNAIAITDNSISDNNEYAAALFMQTPLPENGGPLSDNNAYYISDNSGAATVKLVEMSRETNQIDYEFSRNDFENLDQWSIFTGSDRNSIEYAFLNDMELTDDDVRIKRENGQFPLASKLNNRGRILSYLENDKNGSSRGVTGERYDIGAEEFRGRLYTADVEMIAITEPAAYKSTVVDPMTGNDFTNEEHVMTAAPIEVKAQVRNDGSLPQVVDVTLNISVEDTLDSDAFGEPIRTVVKQANIASTNDVIVEFELDSGSEPWIPLTYSDYLNNSTPGDDYDVPARYVGMEANVTPRIKLEVIVGSDENNGNNTVEKIVRFYIVRTESGVILSTVNNNENVQSGDAVKVGGRLNTQQVRQGMLNGMNWVLNPSNGDYDYDLFDRTGWEKRSVDYTFYNIMFWADGGAAAMGGGDANDAISRFEVDHLSEFLARGSDSFKTNLVSASQGLARVTDAGIAEAVFGLNYDNTVGSTPMGGTAYLNDPAYQVRGDNVAEDRLIDIENPFGQPTNLTELDPYPIVVNPSSQVPGRSLSAFTYVNYDENVFPVEPNMGVAYTTLTNNAIYLGLEWRHISNIGLTMQGIMDYLNSNGGFIIPIELASFDANQVGDKVMIEWSTKSEENSSHFIVEKAVEGNEVFTNLATVKAQGNTSTETQYTPVFDEDVQYGETYLYKLRKVDLDGSWEYSETVDVTLLGADLTLSQVGLTPNPTRNGNTTLEFNSTNNGNITVEIYDMAGNLLLNSNFDVNAGSNNFNLELGNVANGVYNVVIRSGNYNVTRTLNVTR